MKFLKLFFALSLLITFNACSDDDDVVQDNLVGSWKVTEIDYSGTSSTAIDGMVTTGTFTGTGTDMDLKINFTEEPNNYTTSGDYSINLEMVILGQTSEETWTNQGFVGAGTWTKSGNTLTITSGGETNSATILEETADMIKLQWDFQNIIEQFAGGYSIIITQDVSGTYTFVRE